MAKKNRSLEELQNNINQDFIERRDELHFLKGLVEKNLKTQKGKYLAKNLIVCLYSHWEGFIKYSSECYLQFVSHRNFKYKDLNTGLIAISHIHLLNELLESNVALKIRAIDMLFKNQNEKAEIPYEYAISTYSNLNTETLEEICMIVGIDENQYSTKKGLIDERLLNNRNQIAHGNLIRVEPSDIIEIYELVFPIMESYRNNIVNRALQISVVKT